MVTLKDLILARPDTRIREIMSAQVKTLPLDAKQMDVAEFISKYNLLAAPVVDEEKVLRGIITVDDVVELLLPTASRKRRRKR